MAITLASPPQASSTTAPPLRWSVRSRETSRAFSCRGGTEIKGKNAPAIANFGHFVDVVRKDVEFLKGGISRGVGWAKDALRVPQLSKALEDAIWLRNIEDPYSPPFRLLSWPQPYYPELSGVDLLMADLKALETYANYFYYLSKQCRRPLPEIYNPQDVADYFNCRPHVVALRIIEVFYSFALAAIRIRMSGLQKLYLPDGGADENIPQYNFGMVLKETLLNLGPTFIKVGQSLSTRPDIIGSEISKALSGLHDQIPPFSKTLAMKIIEEELGSPVKAFFSYFSDEPVAAASFGQVYRANTLDGFDVAVKVQRPNLHHVVVRDIYILRLGLGLLQKIAKRKSDLRLYADELGKGFVGELNYTSEAANALEFMKAHSDFPFIRVPKVYQHLTRKRILTMEWMAGDKPSDLVLVSTNELSRHGSRLPQKLQDDAKRRLLDMVNKGVEASLVQLLDTGLLHADPHPGNLCYMHNGQLGFMDFGLLCRMEKRHQFAMLASIVHIVNGDWASLIHSLTEMDVVRPGTNRLRVTMDLEDTLGEVEVKDGIPDVKFSMILGRIWSLAIKYHFRMPPYYTLVLRSLASLEGLAIAADPNFKTFDAAYPYVVRKLLTDNSAPMRKILHSVVFNRRKEFQWKKLSLFLRVEATRNGLSLITSGETSLGYIPNKATGIFDVVNLVLRLLTSKDGVVLRRLLMTADGGSLIRSILSKEAATFRQQVCRVIAHILHQLILEALGRNVSVTRYSSHVSLTEAKSVAPGSSYGSSTHINVYLSILRDRRLKVIFFKTINSARRDPLLLLRLCWASFIMLFSASALACQWVFVSDWDSYLDPVSFAPKKVAAGA